jgi:hypothetical protein
MSSTHLLTINKVHFKFFFIQESEIKFEYGHSQKNFIDSLFHIMDIILKPIFKTITTIIKNNNKQ